MLARVDIIRAVGWIIALAFWPCTYIGNQAPWTLERNC